MLSIKQILENVFLDLQSPKKTRRALLIEKWPEIVGSKIVEHTKPSINDQGWLTVWVDDSTLAFEIRQKYKAGLIKRVNAVLGEGVVKNVKILVGQIRK